MSSGKPILEMRGVSKAFPGTIALENVHLEIMPGEVHILLGENGAGKSTLVKIISGVYKRDAGEIIFDGRACNINSVKDAQRSGIGIIHQELNLLPEKSIAHNIFVGNEPTVKGLPFMIDVKQMNERSRQLLSRVGLDHDPSTLVKELSIAQQQMVEVAKALSHDVKLLIMDEPTSSLSNREIDKLFEIIASLKSQNIAIIYISHRMDEISVIGDRITILRDGRYIDTVPVKGMDMAEVVKKMVGRAVSVIYERKSVAPGKEILCTENLTGLRFRNINICVRAGEIVSLSGLVGAGRTEIAKALFGYEPILSGSFRLNGKTFTRTTPKNCVRNDMAFLPEDRKTEGLVLPLSITENTVMASYGSVAKFGIFNKRSASRVAGKFKESLKIATPDVEKIVQELSGGNQQKVVIAKWLAADCDFYIFDEPTRGIDVGAKSEIHELMENLVRQGAGILMISSELSEVVSLSDRVYVIRDGDLVAELAGGEITQEDIIMYAVGGAKR